MFGTISNSFTGVDSAIDLGAELAERLIALGCQEVLERILGESPMEPEALP